MRQQGHTLDDILTEEELSHLENLVETRKISLAWVQDVFIPRLSEELDHLDWIEGQLDGWISSTVYRPDPDRTAPIRKRIADRRANVFERALHPNVFERAGTELQKVYRALLTGEVANRWKRYLKEEGLIGVALDVVEGIVTFIPLGIATTARIFSIGELGEYPMKSLAEISVAMPSVIALVRLILGILRQIVLPFIFSMPKVLWNFILDRVRELGKAVRGEE